MRYGNDPHTITARYAGTCNGCGAPIRPGDHPFYYPIGRKLYGEECGCADAAQRDFDSHLVDEDGW